MNDTLGHLLSLWLVDEKFNDLESKIYGSARSAGGHNVLRDHQRVVAVLTSYTRDSFVKSQTRINEALPEGRVRGDNGFSADVVFLQSQGTSANGRNDASSRLLGLQDGSDALRLKIAFHDRLT